ATAAVPAPDGAMPGSRGAEPPVNGRLRGASPEARSAPTSWQNRAYRLTPGSSNRISACDVFGGHNLEIIVLRREVIRFDLAFAGVLGHRARRTANAGTFTRRTDWPVG